MAEFTYLQASGRLGRLGKTRVLLTAKRSIPFGWFLAFAPDDLAKDATVVASGADAHARAARRVARLSPLAGPKLRSVLGGYVALLAEHRAGKLTIEASEMRAYGAVNPDLRERLALAARLDDAEDDLRGLDLGEYNVTERGTSTFEIDGSDTDATLDLFGFSGDEKQAWLRPPSRADAVRAKAIEKAFAGYVRRSPPVVESDGLRATFTHPSQPGVVFQVSALDEAGVLDMFRIEARGVRVERGLRTEAHLAAWAAHLGEHLGLLGKAERPTLWWRLPGASAFWAQMHGLPDDETILQKGVSERLLRAVQNAAVPLATVDLGELGHVRFERVLGSAWENHVHASLLAGPGDAAWRAPQPDYFVAPETQTKIVDRFLAQLARKARKPAGAELQWLGAPMSGRPGVLKLFADRVEPERFTDGFIPARLHEMNERAATVVFVGESLVIVTADGARVSFRFPVPVGVDRTTPMFVSGWWTAPSGDRFASILRVGDRSWRFDNHGGLIEGA